MTEEDKTLYEMPLIDSMRKWIKNGFIPEEYDKKYHFMWLCIVFVNHIDAMTRIHVKCVHEIAIEQALSYWNNIKELYPDINVVKVFRFAEKTYKEEYEPYLNKVFSFRKKKNPILWCLKKIKKISTVNASKS